MRRSLCVIGLVVLCLSAVVLTCTRGNFSTSLTWMPSSARPVIIVDAGHGGIDGGAVGADGTVEKGINLEIARDLEQMLSLFGFQVVMTRTEDTLIGDTGANTVRRQKSTDLHKRLKMTEQYEDALLISIHQNQYSVEKYSGTQVFFSPNRQESRQLAEFIQQAVTSRLQPDNKRQIKPSGKEIFLLYHAKIPSVMVECGFLSNRAELQKLKEETYQRQMSFAIACGILDYCQTQGENIG